MTDAEQDEVLRLHAGLVEDLRRTGELICGAGLGGPSETTVIRSEADAPAPVHDGPQMSAFYLLDVPNLERAMTFAAAMLDPHVRVVEVRHVHTAV